MARRGGYDYGSDDDEDSDDSGFDEGLSSDAFLLDRISKMRDMMSLNAPSVRATRAAAKQETQPTPPTEDNTAVVTEEEKKEVAVEGKTAVVTEEILTSELDEELLMIDNIHELSLNHRKEDDTSAPPAPPILPQQQPPPQEYVKEQETEEEEEEEGYTVTWERGQLGILFKQGPRGETVIRRVNKRASSAESLHFARAGDVLVAIDGVSTRGRGFQEVVEQLRLPNFPVALHFQPLKDSDDEEEDDTATQQHTVRVVRASDAQELPFMDRKQSSVSASSSSMSMNNVPPSPPRITSEASPFAASQEEAVAAYRLIHRAESLVPPVPSSSSQPYLASSSMDDDGVPGPDEYDVIWRYGTLGCGVKQLNGVPTIKSVTPGAATDESVQQLAAGDVMVLINGQRTEAIGFRAVVETMQRAPKPVRMRFRRANGSVREPPVDRSPPRAMPPSRYASREIENLRESRVGTDNNLEASLAPRQYTVLWNDGPLGVQIKARASDAAVVVSKFTGTGNPELCSQINVGDVFVRIAGVEVGALGISGTHDLLRAVHKPVVIVFERSPLPPPVASIAMPLPLPPPPVFDDDEDDRESTVPSFRVLRERQAAVRAQQPPPQARGRESFSGFTPEQRGDTVFGAAGRRAAHDKHRPASYDMIVEERHSEFSGGSHRHNSFDKMDQYERSSDRSHQSGDGHMQVVRGGTDDDPTLPRFSDIETGRVKTSTVSSLPPPPAYLDVFTQSGRALDPRLLLGGAPYRSPPSACSDDQRGGGGSVTSSQDVPVPSYSAAYPRDNQPPRAPPLNMSMAPYMQPPPAYDQYLGNPRNNQRLDVLRQQYIQAERVRNTLPPSTREPSLTQISSYSDLDDSGVMAGYRRPMLPGSPSSPLPPPPPPPPAYSSVPASRQSLSPDLGVNALPPPELWIQWSEGPLGITFRRTNNQIVVSRLTGAGYSRGLEQLRAGDWLVSFGSAGVGSYETNELRLSETMELIKSLPKPVDMCFIVR